MDYELLPVHVICGSLTFLYLFILMIVFWDEFFGSGVYS
jgi:hypothetical protein